MDILRLFAALLVMTMHVYAVCFPSQAYTAYHYAHTAVVIFFVLSGFVIAYTTSIKNTGIRQYAIARLSRLYSVVLPSLVFSILIEIFIKYYDNDIYLTFHRGNSIIHYLFSLLYINEIWFFSAAPPINAPLWSLSYEFSYYLLFGLYFFRKEIKYFPFFLIFSLLIVGPKILLLMPIWLLGVYVFEIPQLFINRKNSIFLSFFFLFLTIVIIFLLPSLPQVIGTPPLFFAAGFLTDFLIGICFSLCLWFFPNKGESMKIRKNSYYFIRKLADLTFPIYILHYPLIYLYKTSNFFLTNNLSAFYLLVIFVLVISVVIGLYLDKHRGRYVIFFNNSSDQLLRILKK